jgi:hypothetical protein
VSEAAYNQVGEVEIPVSVYSPGVDNSRLKNIAPGLRELATGTLAVGYSTEILPKDRLVVSGRTFEIIAPISPDTNEWLHRAVVREIQLPERLLFLALRPEGYDGASNAEPLPELVKVIPHPYITDKPVEMVKESEGSGFEAANLKQIQVAEIARSFFSDANLERLLYCLIVLSDVEVTAEQARDRVFPRFRFNGSPTLENYKWASSFDMSVTLVEER